MKKKKKPRVGKTSLLTYFVKQQFFETHTPTIGADFITKVLSFPELNTTANLQIWDTAGAERFKSLRSAFYRGASAAIIVYDVTKVETFKK